MQEEDLRLVCRSGDLEEVRQIGWSKVMNCFEGDQEEFIVDPLGGWEPVKLLQHEGMWWHDGMGPVGAY